MVRACVRACVNIRDDALHHETMKVQSLSSDNTWINEGKTPVILNDRTPHWQYPILITNCDEDVYYNGDDDDDDEYEGDAKGAM